MNDTEAKRIQQTIAELDTLVHKADARVQFSQYGGGSDECLIRATRNGYLRLGIEFMRAAFAQPSSKAPEQIDVDLDYLVTEDSDVQFDWFERHGEIPATPRSESPSSSWLPVVICALLGISLLLMLVGAVTVLRWLF